MCLVHRGIQKSVVLAGIRASTLRTVGITTRPVQRWPHPRDSHRNSLFGWLGLTSSRTPEANKPHGYYYRRLAVKSPPTLGPMPTRVIKLDPYP